MWHGAVWLRACRPRFCCGRTCLRMITTREISASYYCESSVDDDQLLFRLEIIRSDANEGTMNRLHLEVFDSRINGRSRRITRLISDRTPKPIEIFHEFDRVIPFS